MSQFAFLQAEFPDIFEHAARAEALAHSDPRSTAFYCRLALETGVHWVFRHDRSLKNPYEPTLAAHLAEPTFQALVGQTLVLKARYVKDTGNAAAHGKQVSQPQALSALREFFHVAYWITRTYARGPKPAPDIAFQIEKLPKLAQVPATTLAQLQEVSRRFAETVKARDAAETARLTSEDSRAALEAEVKALQAQIAQIKAANQAKADTHDYREAETRDLFIDLLLQEAGFDPKAADTAEVEVSGMPNAPGIGYVDYVLRGDDGKPLGLVEAKRTRKDPRVGQQQAKLYADCLEAQYGQRPVIFYTNGFEHWMWDDTEHPPRPVQGFLKKDELALMIQRRSTRKPLAPENIDRDIVERFYQHRAIRRVSEAFERDRQRKALLVMATGAGKTRTVIALADLLMRANWAKRILFLADRKALVKQAANAFKTHLPGAATVNLLDDRRQDGRVYVSTYPTMMGLIDETDSEGRRFGVGHFDLIVIDEAHRSVYRKYKAIFDYFDSYLVGLTATPKDEVDHDTYRLFDLQTGVPTDTYGLEEAVKDGFLVPFKAVSLTTGFLDRGIRYDDLSESEKEEWDAIEWDEDGSVPGAVDAPAINQWLFNADTVDRVLQHLMTNGLTVEDGDRLGKTIIFAKNHDHADFIARRFDINYPHLAGHFARVIDFQVSYAQSLIDELSDPAKAPHIAISVDMLDTGIDIPEIVNLVFFKPVRSKTKFWQMIGRGTRLRPDLFGPGRDKDFFYIFDWCRNFEFFNENPDRTEGRSSDPLSKRLFTARVALIGDIDNAAAPDGLQEIRSAFADDLRTEVEGMTLDNFLVRPHRQFVEKYRAKDAWTKLDADSRHELTDHVAGLPSAVTDDDLAAKQFDLLMFRAELALLRSDAGFERMRERIVRTATLLEELSNIPMVAAALPLIEELQTADYWQDVTVPQLETIRRRLRGLVKLIEYKKRPIVFLDIEDQMGAPTEVTVTGYTVGTDIDAFRRKARSFLRPHENHIAVLKLRRNEALTPSDLAELERIFLDAGADETALSAVRADGGLGRFVRSLVGLDREAAKQAFGELLDGRQLRADQLEFLNIIIEHLTERGVMDPRRLYESPFTDFDDRGVEGLFAGNDVATIVRILRDVEKRTAA